ncbi:MAG: hypothetical protein A2218_07295 [Elusimicrobia bacterium RIFOXYA2_FULL_53_38]|nr:MAG: hypothetical protein A2218_07295 [Elusimicrobia bacterium RIFOXYA2_FULL_53_38]
MKREISISLAIVFSFFAATVSKARQAPDCAAFKTTGCYFNGAKPGAKAPLLIYYRGHLSAQNYPTGGLYGGHITGPANILSSARSALTFYGLKQLALDKGLVVLVTGSSDISVLQIEVDDLQSELGYVFPRVSLAAHSGGYVGLSRSIGTLNRVDDIILLDPFYTDFAAKIRPRILEGAACSGFYTPHNAKRYKQYFSGLGCQVEARTGAADHENWVAPCLEHAFSKDNTPTPAAAP